METRLLKWEEVMDFVQVLFCDGNYRMALLIKCECQLGLRCEQLLQITWKQLIMIRQFEINDKRTNTIDDVRISDELCAFSLKCHEELRIVDDSQLCFVDSQGVPFSQYTIEKALLSIRSKYNLKYAQFNFSSFRKIFGRKIIENAGTNGEMALLIVSQMFRHTSISITRKYLAL